MLLWTNHDHTETVCFAVRGAADECGAAEAAAAMPLPVRAVSATVPATRNPRLRLCACVKALMPPS
jgi:hypothetical protein